VSDIWAKIRYFDLLPLDGRCVRLDLFLFDEEKLT
tara:strand:+ start:1114 stop:1218 length:105 start_codon:yes stop_codon:yes gene_type:complete